MHRPTPFLAACAHCGTVQRLPAAAEAVNAIDCAVCETTLVRHGGRHLDAALGLSAAAFLLLVPANTLPFLVTAIADVSRQSVLSSSASAMLQRGFPELGVVIWLFAVAFPLLRFGLLTGVLGCLRVGVRPAWLGRAFRGATALQHWAMADVFLFGFVVAYQRLKATIAVEMGLGAYCLIAAGILTLLVRATLDPAAVWQAIGTPRGRDPVPVPPDPARAIACGGCDLLLPEGADGRRCPRCAARVHARKPNAVGRAMALTVAGALLYIPANVYPIATLPIGFTSVQYNILEGVIDLVRADLYGLALLVFTASFAIPVLKLGVVAWCVASVVRASRARLVLKTRLFGVVDEIGRWSMVDPFVIACFVPVTQYNALVHGNAEPAAPMFTAVVILTMWATRCFDPRLLWASARPWPALSSTPSRES